MSVSKPAFKKQELKPLYNKYDIETLKTKVAQETEPRITISFYRYAHITYPEVLRDELFSAWQDLNVLGRIYVAREGINAQCSIPKSHYASFLQHLEHVFPSMPIKVALAQDAESFYKLVVKVRKKILADGLSDDSYDVTNVGKHLTAEEFNHAMDLPETIVVDVRNNFESEIGYFKGALRPNVDTFKDELPVIKEMLAGNEDKKILLYCTGGIRCEKTSAWLKHQGFKDVNQLHGGIIYYANQVKEAGLENKFIGKNFVFDARMGEPISNDVIATCHQCGVAADTHTNCRWDGCHLLFIQCPSCADIMLGCCSAACRDITKLPEIDQKVLRQKAAAETPAFRRSRRNPKEVVQLQPEA
jgi:UPF0176 protein